MTFGMIFFIVAAILFFLAAVSPATISNATTWGFFCLALGLLLDDYDFGFRRRR